MNRRSRWVVTILVVGLLIPTTFVHAQTILPVLPREGDPKQYEYWDITCSDDHNCTVTAQVFDFEKSEYSYRFERTNDGGLTWTQQLSPFPTKRAENAGRSLTGVYALDSLTVFAYGDSGWVARTTDAGENWEDISIEEWRPIVGMSFFDGQNGLAVGGSGLVLLTSDGGTNWDTIPNFPPVLFRSLRMFSLDSMAIHPHGQGIYYTHDRWQTRDSLPPAVDIWNQDSGNVKVISGILWIDQRHLIAQGKIHFPQPTGSWPPYIEHPYMMTSWDGGQTWAETYSRRSYMYGIAAISILPSGRGVAGGFGKGLLNTTDHGITWSDDTMRTDIGFTGVRDVSMLTERTALAILAVGARGTIARLEFEQSNVEGFIEKVRYGTRIYPNPSTGVVSINKWYDSERGITIVDMLGRPVYTGMLEPGPGSTTLDLSSLPAGLYSLVVNFGDRALPAGRFLMLK